MQGAIYQAGADICGYGRLPFYLAVATKDRVTDLDIFQIDQPTLAMALREIAINMPRLVAVKTGIIQNYWRDREWIR